MLTWIALAVAVITGITKLFTYLLGDKRKIRELKEKQYELEEKLRRALAANNTVAISRLSIELERVRIQLKSYTNPK